MAPSIQSVHRRFARLNGKLYGLTVGVIADKGRAPPPDWYDVPIITKKPMKVLRTVPNPIATQVFDDCERVNFPNQAPVAIPEIKYGGMPLPHGKTWGDAQLIGIFYATISRYLDNFAMFVTSLGSQAVPIRWVITHGSSHSRLSRVQSTWFTRKRSVSSKWMMSGRSSITKGTISTQSKLPN